MKKFIAIVLTLVLLLALGAVPASADEGDDFVMPGAIVDFASQKGYDKWLENCEAYDLISLKTGEYTVHGTNGKVQWEFMEEDGVSFTRFTPIEPLDEKGLDADGNRPANEGDFRMTAEIEFTVGDYDYISFLYRTSPKAHMSQNHIYIRDDQHSGEFEATQGMYTAQNLKNKGEWAVRTLQVSKVFKEAKGTFKSIRIPIAGRVNEYFDIQYIVAYNDKELAENFDIAKYHEITKALEPDPTEEPTAEPTAEPVDEPTLEPVDETETAEPEDKGCGGVIGGAAVAAIITVSMVPIVLKKKRKEK